MLLAAHCYPGEASLDAQTQADGIGTGAAARKHMAAKLGEKAAPHPAPHVHKPPCLSYRCRHSHTPCLPPRLSPRLVSRFAAATAYKEGEKRKPPKVRPPIEQVEEMHDAFCAQEGNAELEPCMMWSKRPPKSKEL